MLSTMSGLDVHKKAISYCINTASGQVVKEGTLAAQRSCAARLGGELVATVAWAMKATIFSASIYDTFKPYAERLDIGHPAKDAITAGKKKSDAIGARTIADLVRRDFVSCIRRVRRKSNSQKTTGQTDVQHLPG
jgi:hypothetical protein